MYQNEANTDHTRVVSGRRGGGGVLSGERKGSGSHSGECRGGSVLSGAKVKATEVTCTWARAERKLQTVAKHIDTWSTYAKQKQLLSAGLA